MQFPKGSVTSVRISGDDHSFFDLGRHTSLPALPIADTILPPFLGADLTVDEGLYDTVAAAFEPQHLRRPSSPRPAQQVNPHARRFSGQYAAKAPPVSPSALAHAALQSTSISSAGSFSLGRGSPTSRLGSGLSRLSFGNLSNLLGYSSTSSVAAVANSGLSRMKSPREEEESYGSDRPAMMHKTPPSLNHSLRPTRPVYIRAAQQPVPRATRLPLDFGPACCHDEEDVYYV